MDRFEELAEVADAWWPTHLPGHQTRTACPCSASGGRPLMEKLCQNMTTICGRLDSVLP